MPDAVFPKPVAEVLSTLAEIFRHQGQREINELLESAHARFDEIDYDNWNGGTYTWALRLEIPVPIFAALERRLTEVEKEIGAKLNHIARLFPNDHIGEVTLTPIASGSTIRGERMAPSDLEVRRAQNRSVEVKGPAGSARSRWFCGTRGHRAKLRMA